LKIVLFWLTTLASELRRWFWHEASYDQDINCNMGDDNMMHKNKIGVAPAALGLDTRPVKDGGKNECYSIEHMDENFQDEQGDVPTSEQIYEVDGKDYTVSCPTTPECSRTHTNPTAGYRHALPLRHQRRTRRYVPLSFPFHLPHH
jgi:hypothetical protein